MAQIEIDPSEIEVPILEPAADLKAALAEVKRLDALHDDCTDRLQKRVLDTQLNAARKRFHDLQQVPEAPAAIMHAPGDLQNVTADGVEAARAATALRLKN